MLNQNSQFKAGLKDGKFRERTFKIDKTFCLFRVNRLLKNSFLKVEKNLKTG